MLWRLRVRLDDHPGAMGQLSATCGDHGVNILAVDVLPALEGRVTDELVLHTPAGWTADDVRAMCGRAAIDEHHVVECSPHSLEDVPVRYLRAVVELLTHTSPAEALQPLLCQLLDADPGADPDLPERLELADDTGPRVTLARRLPFSDTEWARAAELRRVAALLSSTAGVQTSPQPQPAKERLTSVSVREGTMADLEAVRLMHARCSSETLRRRYLAPVTFVSPRLARAVLEPDEGFSLLVTAEDMGRHCVIAMGLVVVHRGVAEAAVLVEDRWQRCGFGAEVLRQLADRAAASGIAELTLLAHPDNRALPVALVRASLWFREDTVDGLRRFRVPIAHLIPRDRRPGHPAMGAITAPLVNLLHRRAELRSALPAASLIDSAIRDGA